MWVLISNFVLSIAPSVVSKVLLALGIGVVSYAAFSTLADQVVSQVHANYDSMSGVVLQLVNLSGAGTGINIICSALVSKAAFLAMKQMRPL